MVPSLVQLSAKVPIDSAIGPVPVTYNDFEIRVKDIDPNKPICQWTLGGGCTVSTKKLSSFVPGLAKFVDDPSILSIEGDVDLSLGRFYIGIKAEAKLLEEITFAEAEIEAGNIPVESALLGFSNEKAFGLRGKVSGGLKWEITNCKVDVGGSCTLHLHSKFLGAELEGHANVKIGWSIFTAQWSEMAYFSLGLQKIDNIPTLIIRIAASDNDINNGYYFMWNAETNLKYGEIKV